MSELILSKVDNDDILGRFFFDLFKLSMFNLYKEGFVMNAPFLVGSELEVLKHQPF